MTELRPLLEERRQLKNGSADRSTAAYELSDPVIPPAGLSGLYYLTPVLTAPRVCTCTCVRVYTCVHTDNYVIAKPTDHHVM